MSDLSDVVADLELILRGAGPQHAWLVDPTPELADDLHCSEAWLKEIAGLLRRKRQIIFYGPPGTGKTFVAQALADHFTEGGGSTKLVQFHPSYAYEDFVEGYRPQGSTAEGVAFALLPGPFRQLAEAARADPSNPYVLIIDEINRANLAKVFGELYFLLEYRERSIDLQYSPGADFTLPENLFVIGTMNTADRSIALVDAAMRRRFFFVSFFPQDPEIAGMLRSWLRANGCSDIAATLLDALNSRIGDADFAIGPSYLMTPDIDAAGVLELIWRHSILPLLEEHFYGRPMSRSNLGSKRSVRQPRQRETDRVPPIALREHSVVEASIDPIDTLRLHATKVVSVSRSLTDPDAFVLSSKSLVGSLRVGTTEVKITPKVPVRRLMYLLGYCRDPLWRPDETTLGDVDDLVAAMSAAFSHYATQALTRGLLQGYRTFEDALATVRGRIRVGDQMSRRPGQLLPVELTFDEFTVDIVENQLLRTAVERLLRLSGLAPAQAAELRHLRFRLSDISTLAAGQRAPVVKFTRLNERYPQQCFIVKDHRLPKSHWMP